MPADGTPTPPPTSPEPAPSLHEPELRPAEPPPPRYAQRGRPLTCSGVGTGSQHASYDVEMPIGLGNGLLDGYSATGRPSCPIAALSRCLAASRCGRNVS